MTHEMWMYNQAAKNPAYNEQLFRLTQFPLVFTPPPPPPPTPEELALEAEEGGAPLPDEVGVPPLGGEVAPDQAALPEAPLQPTGGVA